MLLLKLLLRAALQLRSALLAKAADGHGQEQWLLGHLAEGQRCLTHSLRQVNHARRRGLSLVIPRLQEGLRARLKAFQDSAERLCRHLEQSTSVLPDLRTMMAELSQVEAEFGTLEIDLAEKRLCVTTEPITLEGVYLGEFSICMDWLRFPSPLPVSCFKIVALNPQPASDDARVTHPHVKNETLCAGDAAIPLQRALEEGRLADAFCLIRSVLTHYNPASPHVALSSWMGKQCHDCGCCIDEDHSWNCSSCEKDFCEDCTRICMACCASRCLECITRCAFCEEVCCCRCLGESAYSGEACCPDCLTTCAGCGAGVGKQELLAPSGLCPTCPKPGVPPAPANPTTPNLPIVSSNPIDAEEHHAETFEPIPPAAA